MTTNNCKITACYIRQLRRYLRDMAFCLYQIEELNGLPECVEVAPSTTAAENLRDWSSELVEKRRDFNRIFRSLQYQLTKSCADD